MKFRLTALLAAMVVVPSAQADISFLTPDPTTSAAGASSGQAVTANTTRLQTDNRLYQALYSLSIASGAQDWTGELKEIEIPSDGIVTSAAVTSASTDNFFSSLSHPDSGDGEALLSGRNLYSYSSASSSGVSFSASLLTSVSGSIDSVVSGATVSGLAAYISGNQLLEDNDETSSGSGVYKGFRERSSRMGDIINSAPEYAGNIDFGYHVTASAASAGAASVDTTMGQAYLTYLKTGSSATRLGMVYIGSNDGMLHGFRADDSGTNNNQLEEVFAYIPEAVLPKLASLAMPSYNHQYTVDASPRVADAHDGSDWKTVLAGTTGTGGRSVFALDVTDPVTSFGTANVLWEISNESHNRTSGFGDLGYTLAQPSIVMLQDNSPYDDSDNDWVAVLSSGYDDANSDGTIDNNGVLYLIDIFTGSTVASVAAGSAGLSTPIAIDSSDSSDPDMAADIIYAGDLDGKLWKFSYDDSTDTWSSLVLFNAGQPITAKPQVVDHPDGGFMVFFGTGQYFQSGDENTTSGSPTSYRFYGIWDENDGTAAGTNLDQVSIILAGKFVNGIATEVDLDDPTAQFRITSESSGTDGWYMELINVDDPDSSNVMQERVVSEPLVRNDRVIFTTLIPDGTPYSGSGWVMEVDAITGSRLDEVALDLNGDGKFDDDDKVSIKTSGQGADISTQGGSELANISGLQSNVGLISTPNVISTANKEFKYLSGSSGEIETVQESTTSASFDKGRQSWQQLK